MTRDAATRGVDIPLYTLRQRIFRGRLRRERWLIAGAMALCVGMAGPWSLGQKPLGQKALEQNRLPSKPPAVENPLAESPRSWVVDTVANELTAMYHPGSYLRYRMHTIDTKGDRVRELIESKDGPVARLILKDGRPLTEEEDKAERQRLTDMIASPSDYAKHVKHEDEGKKLADQLMRLLPDAMIYTYTPGQPQTGNNGGALEVVLDYKPNPKFNPPSTPAQALTGLEGRVWIDAKSRQLVRLEGTIFRAVNFGWGMLAHIYPGGRVTLDQTHVGNGRWIFTHFTQQVKVRALLVKTINVNADVSAESFETLPGPISYQDAVRMLLDTPLPIK